MFSAIKIPAILHFLIHAFKYNSTVAHLSFKCYFRSKVIWFVYQKEYQADQHTATLNLYILTL